MSGHSKWSTIKRKKGKADAERGRQFTKLIKEITLAARLGGGDESSNPRLRTAIAAAKSGNMPSSNIDRAIKKGTGELPGVTYEEAIYEGYGPGGVALLFDVYTDNRNRTVAEIRYFLNKFGGSMAEAGSVVWQFEKRGLIVVSKSGVNEDQLFEIALEAGADDVRDAGESFEVLSSPEDLEGVKEALTAKSISFDSADLTMDPKSTVQVEGKNADQLLKLLDALEDHDDIQHLYSNFDMDDSLLEDLSV